MAVPTTDTSHTQTAILFEEYVILSYGNFDINLKFEAAYPRGPPTNISETFYHIPTTFHLTEVELDRHLFDSFLWDDLSQVLLRPQFSKLRRVSLILRPGHVRRSWKDKVFEQMSSLHSRGILSVTEIID